MQNFGKISKQENRAGICQFQEFKIFALGINEAIVQYITAKALGGTLHRTNNEKITICTNSENYYKYMTSLIAQILFLMGNKEAVESCISSTDRFENELYNTFEENTEKIEELIRQREANIALAAKLKNILNAIVNKEANWKQTLKEASNDFSEDIIDTLGLIGRAKSKKSQNCQDAMKLINARIANLESNLHIEIDMERIEDRSKALSYIGIEIADALKAIPAPQEEKIIQEADQVAIENEQYIEETRVKVKPTLWQRIKNSKFGRTVSKIMRIRIVVQIPTLPEGKEE